MAEPDPTRTEAWRALAAHHAEMAATHMRDLFLEDPDRFDRFSLEVGGILLDYSKNLVTQRTLELLIGLARQTGVAPWRDRMFDGDRINATEQRAVLHVALRNRSGGPIRVDGRDVMPAVDGVLARMREFSEAVRHGRWRGHSGERITDVVNIGIGGSDLGPAMVCQALEAYTGPQLKVHFLSNVDGAQLAGILERVRPQSTLFVVTSKTFTTLETMTNARSARAWFLQQTGGPGGVPRHFVAVSSNAQKVREFGIDPEHMFELWDWVGGRFSLWSAVGLPIALAVGMEHFDRLLEGAHAMDLHFREAELERNMPVIMAMLGVWYHNFFGAESHVVVPYDHSLRRLTSYLQQLDMESNGKCVDRNGQLVQDYRTGPIVWGGPGTNAQHAFFQLLHQGTRLVPADFIAPVESHHPTGDHHRLLLANFFAQAEALMRGKSRDEAAAELAAAGVAEADASRLAPHKASPGNRPTNTLLVRRFDPYNLGMLLALYEHKVFVQGAVWGINSFDQWGVELGKQLASDIVGELESAQPVNSHDCSTNGLINHYKRTLGRGVD